VTNSSVWSEDTKIFSGNCPFVSVRNKQDLYLKERYHTVLDLIYVGMPKSRILEDLSGYKLFRKENTNRLPMLFVLSNQEVSKEGILYKLDAKTDEEIDRFILPMNVQGGTLVEADVFYEDRWHSLLVLTAIDSNHQKSLMLVFDVTDPKGLLRPFLIYTENDLSIMTTKPVVLRLNSNQFGIAVGGHLKNRGVLHVILLENFKLPVTFTLGKKAVSCLAAVDMNQRAAVDRIYLSDDEHLWVLNMANPDRFHVKLLADVNLLHSLIVVPSVQTQGLRLYFLGSVLERKGLFMFEDPLDNPHASVESPSLIHEGDYAALFVRFGQLFVVPKMIQQAPLLLALPSHRFVPMMRQVIYSTSPVEGVVFISRLLWDPKKQQEVLLTLNLSCQLTISVLHVDRKPYGRIMWRKMKH